MKLEYRTKTQGLTTITAEKGEGNMHWICVRDNNNELIAKWELSHVWVALNSYATTIPAEMPFSCGTSLAYTRLKAKAKLCEALDLLFAAQFPKLKA